MKTEVTGDEDKEGDTCGDISYRGLRFGLYYDLSDVMAGGQFI